MATARGKRWETKPVGFDDTSVFGTPEFSVNIGNFTTFNSGQWNTILGPFAGIDSTTSVAVGMFSTIGAAMSNCTVVGQFSRVLGPNGGSNLIAGAGNTIYEGCNSTTICGSYSDVAQRNGYSFIAGPLNHVGQPNMVQGTSNVVIGAFFNVGLATDTFARSTVSIPGPADYINYDNAIFPDGSGGTITVMFQADGTYVDPGGVYTVDVQGMTTAQEVWNAIWAILQANTTLGDNGGSGDPIWQQSLNWSVAGIAGNGQTIVNNVASPNFQVTPFEGGAAYGCGRNSVFVGSVGTAGTEFETIVSIGCNNKVGGLQRDSTIIGSQNRLGNISYTTPPLGGPSLGGYGNVLMGALLYVPDDVVMATAIGYYASANGNCSIALGPFASAGANQFIVGVSDITSLDRAIHTFAVRGYNVGALDTLLAIDNPADGYTGLTVVFNAGGTYSNKSVQAAAAPPPGSLLLFVAP
jgi:hypothetical protein